MIKIKVIKNPKTPKYIIYFGDWPDINPTVLAFSIIFVLGRIPDLAIIVFALFSNK